MRLKYFGPVYSLVSKCNVPPGQKKESEGLKKIQGIHSWLVLIDDGIF